MSFRAFDPEQTGEIAANRMRTLLPVICRAIERSSNQPLPYPFDSKEGIIEWIKMAYQGLEKMNEPMNLVEYHVVGKSSAWALSLFTLGCYLPERETMDTFPMSPPKSSHLKRKARSQSTTPKRADESNEVPKEITDQIEAMKKQIKAYERRERVLKRKIKEERAARQAQEVEEEDDEWTESEGEEVLVVQTEETMEEQNERLIVQVRSLQQGLKQFMADNQTLRKENEELKEKNENLKQYARKLAKNQDSVPAELISHTPSEEEALYRQIDDYHSILSWTLQEERIARPDAAAGIPVPPGGVQRAEILMKRGDFIQNWKKRLVIATADSIIYYSDPMKPRGQIDLRTIRGVRESGDPGSLPNTLEIITPDRVWALSFTTKSRAAGWKDFVNGIAKENADRAAKLKQKKQLAANRQKELRVLSRSPGRPSEDLWAT